MSIVKDGKETPDPFILSYKPADAVSGAGTAQDPKTFNFHTSAGSVVAPHSFGAVLVQACVAILLLVGFESVTAMGEEAKNPKKDIGRAVLLSLAIQGAVCYLFEYFAANYFLNSGYTMSNAGASGAPLGRHDGAGRHVGVWQLFGGQGVHAGGGRSRCSWRLIGTTLSCMNTGARVTYAMGRDEEVPHAVRHVARQDPLAASRGLVPGRSSRSSSASLRPWSIWAAKARTWRRWTSITSGTASASSRRTPIRDAAQLDADHHADQQLRHVPALYDHLHRGHRGLPRAPQLPRVQALGRARCSDFWPTSVACCSTWLARSACAGMSCHEPYIALGFAAVWGVYGVFYFKIRRAQRQENPCSSRGIASALGCNQRKLKISASRDTAGKTSGAGAFAPAGFVPGRGSLITQQP